MSSTWILSSSQETGYFEKEGRFVIGRLKRDFKSRTNWTHLLLPISYSRNEHVNVSFNKLNDHSHFQDLFNGSHPKTLQRRTTCLSGQGPSRRFLGKGTVIEGNFGFGAWHKAIAFSLRETVLVCLEYKALSLTPALWFTVSIFGFILCWLQF